MNQSHKRWDTVAQFILDKICSIKMLQNHMSIFSFFDDFELGNSIRPFLRHDYKRQVKKQSQISVTF